MTRLKKNKGVNGEDENLVPRSIKMPKELYEEIMDIKDNPYSRMKSFNDLVVTGARLVASLERKHIDRILEEVQDDAVTEFLQGRK